MTIRIYNTLAREKQDLEPVSPGRVGMYVCGPTVYDYAHIGNARPVIVFDVLYRLLRHEFGVGNVKYVRNITDVDDKIIAAADESGEEIGSITARTTEAFHADVAALGALPPDEEPRATGHIPEMIALIEDLIAKDHAYEADGHVLFDVSSMAGYGRLSRHSQDELIAGSRVEGRALQAKPNRLRALETVHRFPARLGRPLGLRAARLAPRMLGHVGKAFGRHLRYTRRRPGFDFSPPRKRDRPVHLLPRRRDLRQILDA